MLSTAPLEIYGNLKHIFDLSFGIKVSLDMMKVAKATTIFKVGSKSKLRDQSINLCKLCFFKNSLTRNYLYNTNCMIRQ